MPTRNPITLITPATVMPTGRRMGRFTARLASGVVRAAITTGVADIGTAADGMAEGGTAAVGTAVAVAAAPTAVVVRGAAAAARGDMDIDVHRSTYRMTR